MSSPIKDIHSIWIGPSPAPRLWLDSVENFSKTFKYKHTLWDNQLVEKFPMKNRKYFDAAKSFAGKADILRYEILERHGGIYIDADMVILQPGMLNLLLQTFNGDSAFGYEIDSDLIANSVIIAQPGSEFMKVLIDAIPTRDLTDVDWKATGPQLLTEMYHLHSNSIDIRVYPRIWFYPQSWHGISSLDLHMKVKHPPESMMFQYGYSTNHLGKLIGPDGYSHKPYFLWIVALPFLVVLILLAFKSRSL
jgi:mannosyltransferase OCH1-like enzyme